MLSLMRALLTSPSDKEVSRTMRSMTISFVSAVGISRGLLVRCFYHRQSAIGVQLILIGITGGLQSGVHIVNGIIPFCYLRANTGSFSIIT